MVKSIAPTTDKLTCYLKHAILLTAVLTLQMILWPGMSFAQGIIFFRIGTGNISGTLFAVGSTIANVISNPPGSRWVAYTPTVAVSMQLVVSSDADEELIYQITKALWHERSRVLLETGHLQGRHILLENARDGISIPVHPGAARFYQEQGIQH